MKNLEIIISVSGALIGLLVTTITFLTKAIKNTKAKKQAERLLMINEALLPFIQTAEEYTNYTGKEKKEYVLTKANQYFIQKGLKFDEELCASKIEELVALTKKVNAKAQGAKQTLIPNPFTTQF
jgi:uncharacterized membrane protein YbaN (DUF454 family)